MSSLVRIALQIVYSDVIIEGFSFFLFRNPILVLTDMLHD